MIAISEVHKKGIRFGIRRLGKSGENELDVMKHVRTTYREQVPRGGYEELFGEDPRPCSPRKSRPANKSKSETTTSTGESNSSNPFGDMMSTEFRLKLEAIESAYKVAKDKKTYADVTILFDVNGVMKPCALNVKSEINNNNTQSRHG
ncbi:hypothetical protein Tco_1230873, partial [Tanacetum coccineum]